MPIYKLSDALLFEGDYKIAIDPCPKYLLTIPPPAEDRNFISGDAANNFISGTDGHDIQHGRDGDDVLYGSPGYDEMRGGFGNDTVDYYWSHCPVTVDLEKGVGWGGDAHGDTYFGIDNVIGSNGGDDTLIGDHRDNLLDGSGGADIIEGGRGNDNLRGGGGDGGDTLRGGAGDDTLYGGRGENVLTGDGGDDVFRFLFIETVTTVTDFTVGEDRIELVGFGDFAFFMANATNVGNDVHFTRDNNFLSYTAQLIIENVSLKDLDAGDFLFS